ncbi:MAG: hypothetical protein R2873_30285 [Caldilineaceae bacterium]
MAKAAGVEAQIVHVPSDLIAAFDANMDAGLLGDKAHSVIFDNSKVKRLVPDFVCTTPLRPRHPRCHRLVRRQPRAPSDQPRCRRTDRPDRGGDGVDLAEK